MKNKLGKITFHESFNDNIIDIDILTKQKEHSRNRVLCIAVKNANKTNLYVATEIKQNKTIIQ